MRLALPALYLISLVSTTFAATMTVMNTNDSGAGSLRAALAAAAPGDTIVFDSSVTGTITLTGGELLINKDLTIIGPGASQLAISGNNASRVFEINFGTVNISGLTIENGNASGGGGIFNPGGTLTLTNSTVSGNSATLSGGGIFNPGGTLTIKNTLLASNSSGGNCLFQTGSNTSQGYNLSDDNTCASTFTATGDQNNVVAGAGLASTTPQNNGGPTPTVALLPTSPAVDHIPAASCTVATDQRGVTRPQGAACDVGAFELGGNAPTISKSFGTPTILLNGTTSLSFTITAPNSNAVTDVGFTDTLPSGLVVAFPFVVAIGCPAGDTLGTITAIPGAGTVSLSGASLAADTSCTFSVNVTGTTAGQQNNSVTVNSNQGTGNTAMASLTVLMPPPPPAPPAPLPSARASIPAASA